MKGGVVKAVYAYPKPPPIITTTPAVVAAIGAKRGDIVKIIRKSPTAEEFITYRLVQD